MEFHIVLLGDSIFDNGAYVGDGLAVITQLRAMLPSGDKATLLAVDGHRVADVAAQLKQLPPDATHLVISAGGNDALDRTGILDESVASVAHALSNLAGVGEKFAADYRRMLQGALTLNLPTTLCTIYDANFPDAEAQRVIKAALSHFNDGIIRAAIDGAVPLLDLRAVCNEPADYANTIEPSSVGGAKIARAICNIAQQHDFAARRTTIYVN